MSFLESASAGRTERTRQLIGYVGSLDERWVNRDLILKTAQMFPETSVVILSPIDRSFARAARQHKNIEFLPPCPHEKLAELVATFDVALVPFRKNEITRVTNPLKLYEYCSAGLPIVATKTDELSHYPDLVHLSESDDEFLTNVQIALDETDAQKRSARVRFARANTWEARTDALLQFIHEGLEVRKSV
jgi:glycosyltransferase involved in cell wall biosynthesis